MVQPLFCVLLRWMVLLSFVLHEYTNSEFP